MILSTNKNDLNFLAGLIEIASIDQKVIQELTILKEYYLEKYGENEYKKLENILEQKFDIYLANKEFDSEKKDLFFNLSITVAFLDDFSEKEENRIRDLAELLNYPQDKINQIISEIKAETAKNLDFDLFYWFSRMIKGYVNYLKTGITKFDAYYSFRHLHFLTNNRLNKLMIFLTSIVNPNQSIKDKKVLGNSISQVVESIKEKGYFIFDQTISENIINSISNFALDNNSYPIFSNKKYSECFEGEGVLFKDTEYITTRYEYQLKDLLNNPDIFNLLLQEDFSEISKQYFNSKALLSNLNMWWTTPIKEEFDRYTGQVFHIDIDRSQALLFIIYINDVDENNGPHIYVQNTHQSKPLCFLQDRRMNPQELEDYYSKENMIEITGKKGTVFVIDSLGFHRGKPLDTNNRLALKYEYSVDGFGEILSDLRIKNPETKKIVEQLAEEHEHTFSKFLL